MTALIIVLSILAFSTLLLLLPISLDIKFEGDFFLRIKFAGIKVFEIEPKSDIKQKVAESDKQTEQKAENLFGKLKKKHGFIGAVKEIFIFANGLLSKFKNNLKHILVRRLCLDINIASSDAAQTAIEYGAVCSVVYPTLSLICSLANVKLKQININADFDKKEPDFSFSAIIRVKVIFLLKLAFIAFSEYKNFRMRNEL